MNRGLIDRRDLEHEVFEILGKRQLGDGELVTSQERATSNPVLRLSQHQAILRIEAELGRRNLLADVILPAGMERVRRNLAGANTPSICAKRYRAAPFWSFAAGIRPGRVTCACA